MSVIYHCPFCAEEDLRPVAEPQGAWHCLACARIFSVTQHRIAAEGIPGRIREEAETREARLRRTADEAQARFTALEDSPEYQGHLGRVELSREVLRWAAAAFGTQLTAASSMGDEVLVELIAQTEPAIDVFFLDTGYHFDETLETRDHYNAKVQLRTVLPLLSVEEQDAQFGSKLHDRDPDQCCAIRKVEPLNRALSDHEAWITGLRRVDAPTRTDITLVGWDDKRQMVKINPIAAWDADDVERFAFEEDVHLNPLRERGYASIGCAPCTRPVAAGEDPRAGRWSGKNKTECGLHT